MAGFLCRMQGGSSELSGNGRFVVRLGFRVSSRFWGLGFSGFRSIPTLQHPECSKQLQRAMQAGDKRGARPQSDRGAATVSETRLRRG